MERSRMGPWRREAHDFTRAFSGAFLFGAPLLFTMEMWQIGLYVERWKLFIFLLLAFLVNLGLNHVAGFKDEAHTFGKALNQAVDAVAVGIVGASAVLLVLDRIGPGEPLDSIVGQIAMQAVPLSIGASTANVVLNRGNQQEDGEDGGDGGRDASNSWLATLNDLGATIAGGIVVGFSIAPTEEVPLLAGELDYLHKLALIGLTLVVTYGIVFASGFDPEHAGEAGRQSTGIFQHPITETAMSYIVSLLVALVTLFLLDQIAPGDPVTAIVAQTLVLGFVTSIGGAAGRVII